LPQLTTALVRHAADRNDCNINFSIDENEPWKRNGWFTSQMGTLTNILQRTFVKLQKMAEAAQATASGWFYRAKQVANLLPNGRP
jgi:hypothetical protein